MNSLPVACGVGVKMHTDCVSLNASQFTYHSHTCSVCTQNSPFVCVWLLPCTSSIVCFLVACVCISLCAMLTKNDFLCSHRGTKPHIGHTKNERRQITTTINIYIEREGKDGTHVWLHTCAVSLMNQHLLSVWLPFALWRYQRESQTS